MDRREGRRGVFEASGVGLANGDSSSSSVERGDWGLAKSMASTDSSRGMVGAGAGGEAMAVSKVLSLWHERINGVSRGRSLRSGSGRAAMSISSA